jgi:hypothetical protein
MGFFSFIKYTFIIFAAHVATSCGSPFENHCSSCNALDLNSEGAWDTGYSKVFRSFCRSFQVSMGIVP